MKSIKGDIIKLYADCKTRRALFGFKPYGVNLKEYFFEERNQLLLKGIFEVTYGDFKKVIKVY